jgi:steroid delta-isomerase-like uncharacterized protein
MLESNKQLVRRWVEEMCGQGRLEVADEIFSPDVVDHNPIAGQALGVAGQKQVLEELWVSFPDFHTRIEDLVAEGDRVVLRWSGQGTHQGSFAGITPTGRGVTYSGIDIVRIADNKIVERWGLADDADLLQQIEQASSER